MNNKVIISRDVVFEEEKKWNWDESYQEFIRLDLEEGEENDEITQQNHDTQSNEEEEKEMTSDAIEAVVPSANPTTSNAREIRVIRAPVWMNDYVIGEDVIGEEEYGQIHCAFFASSDPISFEEAVQSEKW